MRQIVAEQNPSSSEAAFAYLREVLQAGHISTMELHRGQVDLMRTTNSATEGGSQSSKYV